MATGVGREREGIGEGKWEREKRKVRRRGRRRKRGREKGKGKRKEKGKEKEKGQGKENGKGERGRQMGKGKHNIWQVTVHTILYHTLHPLHFPYIQHMAGDALHRAL